MHFSFESGSYFLQKIMPKRPVYFLLYFGSLDYLIEQLAKYIWSRGRSCGRFFGLPPPPPLWTTLPNKAKAVTWIVGNPLPLQCTYGL